MADHPALPNLAERIAEEVRPPAFDTLVRRAHDRRRHQLVAGAGVAALLVLGILAGTSLVGHDTSTPPVAPSPKPSPATPSPDNDAKAAAVIRDGDLDSYATGTDGSVLTTWQVCGNDGNCEHAWQLRAEGHAWKSLVAADLPAAYRAGGVFVVSSYERLGFVLGRDGHTTPLRRAPRLDPKPQDALVTWSKGLLLVDPACGCAAPMPHPSGDRLLASDGRSTRIGADGTLFLVGSRPPRGDPSGTSVAWLRNGRWTTAVLSASRAEGPVPGFLAVAGDHVAAISTYDGATIAPLGTLGISTDAGRTWTRLHKGDVPFDDVDSIAATSTGTLFVLTADGQHLYRSAGSDWTRFERVAISGPLAYLQDAGTDVTALAGGYQAQGLVGFDEAGREHDLGPLR
jgi:hypothetical protein